MNSGDQHKPKILQELARLSQAVAAAPENPKLRVQLGFTFLRIGEHQQALGCFNKAENIDSTLSDAWFGEAVTLFELSHQSTALEKLNLAINRAPTDQRLWSARAHMLASTGEAPETVLKAYEQWGKRFPNKLITRPPQTTPRVGNHRIRLGYLSGDFRNHALRYFFLPVLAHHDRQKFELFGIFNGEKDDCTPLFSAHFEHWHTSWNQSDEQLAHLLYELDLDILVDLSGHTAGNRLMALAQHPARHQITWYGYNCTTGMQAMDYRLTDDTMDPEGNDRYSTEKLLRLPSFACYQPPANLPPPPPLPVLSNGYITFGCLNNPQKITPATLQIWAEILRRLPDARLRMIAPYGPTGEFGNKPNYLEHLSSNGIPVERVDLIPKLSMADFLKQNHHIDIALEPIPFSGGVTTAHCLWMGIPTITTAGSLPFSRAAASIVTAADLSWLSTNHPDQYINEAIALAQEIEKLSNLRLSLREILKNSLLFNYKHHVQTLELLFKEINIQTET